MVPVDLLGTVGVSTIYERDSISGNFRYAAIFSVQLAEPISALEVRFLLFDVWGNHIRTLSLTEVADISSTKSIEGKWNLFSENEAEEYYASIAYVARVRTRAGKVFEADPTPVIEEAKRFSKKFSAEGLEPNPPKK